MVGTAEEDFVATRLYMAQQGGVVDLVGEPAKPPETGLEAVPATREYHVPTLPPDVVHEGVGGCRLLSVDRGICGGPRD